MKLKIKVKNLIMLVLTFLFVVLVVAPLINLEIGIYLNSKGSEKAEIFYNNYMASPIKITGKRGLYEYGRSLIKGFERYKITSSGWGGGEKTRPEDMDKAMEVFEEVLLKDKKDGYKDEYSTKSYSKLLDTSIATLDMDKLTYWIAWGKDKENEEIKSMSKLYEGYYYFVQKDYKKSKEILEDLDENKLDEKYYQLMGDINLQLGNVDMAKEYYEKVWSDHLESMDSFRSYFGGSNSYPYEDDIEKHLRKSQGDYKVKGKVSNNGKGLPFVEVYVSEDVGVFRVGGEMPDAITDANGEFETLGLKQGVYEMGIKIHPSQLYNKVYLKKDIWSVELNSDIEFDFDFSAPMEVSVPKEKMLIKEGEDIDISWDEVRGADYYMIESLVFTDPRERTGGSHTIGLKGKSGDEKIRDNSISLNVNDLDKTIGALSFEGEEEIVNPTGIFGSFIANIEYPLVVNAYDKENNLIASTLTLISDYEDLISMEIEGELTQGENLILDKKYEEAISHYEDQLIEDPKDKEALFYLVRFYSIGWKKGEKDLAKAFKYAEIYDKEYEDYNLSFEVANSIYRDEMDENKKFVKRILDQTAKKDRNDDYYDISARYYLTEGDLLKARESYEKMTRDRSINLVYIDIYLEDYKKAISTLKDGKIFLIKMNTSKVIEGLDIMDNASEEDKKLVKDLLKMTLDNKSSRNEEEAIYKKTLNLVNNLEIKEMIIEIGKEEYWDMGY
ncbi:MAG: tetratricopeptide repeat protein [Tissierella sp.]|uniref:tetratricopeptide repeat protein n=1 Tax=Tissierella sp. TaxID=41274 RepID=UPI003F9D61D0